MTARDRILEAGFALFLAHGVDGTGLSAILATAEISKGAFYHHFESKQALYEEVIARFFPSPFDAIDWQNHARKSARAQKEAIEGFYADLVSMSATSGWDANRYYALFFDSLSRLPRFHVAIKATYDRLVDALAAALVRDDGLTRAEAEAAALQFVALHEGNLYLAAVTGRTLFPSVSE